MWPYYKASVIDKTFQPMTRDEVIELAEAERLKICERGRSAGRFIRETLPGINDLHITTLGGLDVDGNDASNDLTDVILEAALNIGTNEPSLVMRYTPKLKEKTRRLTFECIAQGYGFPSIKHEEKNTRQNIEFYKWPKEEAVRWANVLCMAPGVTGRAGTQKSRTEGGGGALEPKCVEVALYDGFDPSFSNKQLGPHTGDATKFKTYEELEKAVITQINYGIKLWWKIKDIARWFECKYYESSFLSLMDDFCIEDGIGAIAQKKYPNAWADYPMSGGSAPDNLAAIKYWVFDQKKYTMEELIKALRADWEGYDEMRRDMLAAPKWGNDDDYVDEIGRRVYDAAAEAGFELTTYSGGHPMPVPQTVGAYVNLAPRVGAEPFGRKHGEVLHDGGCSPYAGLDKKGPTAVLKTMSKIPQEKYKGIQFNQRLPVGLMRDSEKGFDVWTAYMKTWHDFNIDHVQFNVVRSEDMRAAQAEPEKWGHLIVRIAGYSARFITLTKIAQDSIIARTQQEIG
jgi:pyruvate-formate lyase